MITIDQAADLAQTFPYISNFLKRLSSFQFWFVSFGSSWKLGLSRKCVTYLWIQHISADLCLLPPASCCTLSFKTFSVLYAYRPCLIQPAEHRQQWRSVWYWVCPEEGLWRAHGWPRGPLMYGCPSEVVFRGWVHWILSLEGWPTPRQN